jgi:adenylate cyclase class IV
MQAENSKRGVENSVTKKLAEEPILLPESPFWEILRDFGKDELIALGINTAGVFALSTITDDRLAISLIGPVLEKFGFFTSSSKKAYDVYQSTLPEERKSKGQYVLDAVRLGLPNFLKDLALHDPMYTGLMLLELQKFPETPPWMLSAVAFMISVSAVSAAEVTTKEILYSHQLKKFKENGFALERQLESRFVVKNPDSEEVLQELAAHFDLGPIHSSAYHDTYFEPRLKKYNSRQPAVRLRKRTEQGKMTEQEEIQVMYTRASALKRKHPEQYNYYPVAKDKLKLPLSKTSQKFLQTLVSSDQKHEVSFTRRYAHIPGKMLISTDQVERGQESYTVIEVKSFREEKDAVARMIMAMRHIMANYSVVQTTHSKRELTSLVEKRK